MVAISTVGPKPAGRESQAGTLTPKAFFICILAALAGLMFGLDIGVISGALQFIQAHFHTSTLAEGWIVSSMMAGAAAGAVIAAPMSLHLGRKVSLIIAAVAFVVGALICALAPTVGLLILGRLVLGLAIGVAAFVAPLYLSEIAPEQVRGAMISLYQLMITIGIFLAFALDSILSYTGNWRLMLGIIAVPAVLFLVGMFIVPYSPRWLMLRGKHRLAHGVLLELGHDEQAANYHIAEMEEQLKVKQHGWQMFCQNGNFRRSVFLGIVLQIAQQITGINVLMYYAPKIFEGAGFGLHAASWATAIVGAVNVLSTFIAIAFVDRIGRRPILIASFLIMAVSMAAVGILLSAGVPAGGSRDLVVVLLLIFIVGFAMGAGPLIWVLCAEIQPLKGRDFGIGCSTFTNWAANWVVGFTFPIILLNIGQGKTFWLFAILNLICIPFILFFVPETKGVTLETIEHRLLAGEPLRRLGQVENR